MFTTILGLALLAQACGRAGSDHGLTRKALQKANRDLQDYVDRYMNNSPTRKDYVQAGLNPNMSVLQGSPQDDPVPSHLGLLTPGAPVGSGPNDLASYSPIIVQALRRELRESKGREPTSGEIVRQIQTENAKVETVGGLLESRQSDIASLYAAGNFEEVAKIRQDILKSQYPGDVAGRADSDGDGNHPPTERAQAHLGLLIDYLNNDVTNSR